MPPLAPSDRRAAANNNRRANAPKLEFSATRLDLGDGKPNEIVRGELTLTNPGNSPVAFSLIKHCGCTELAPLAGELAPGASERIQVGLQLASHANSEKNISIEVQAGEPAAIVARCVVSARCPAPFSVTPAFLSFGSLTSEEVGSTYRELRIGCMDGQPPLVADRLCVEHANNAFRVERVGPTSADSVVLRVSLATGHSPGDFYDAVDLRLAGSDYVMRVPLSAAIVEPISVVPATVSLRRDGDHQAFRPVQLLVICRAGGKHLGKVSLADGPPGVEIDDLGSASPGRRRIRLSVSGDTIDWRGQRTVLLHADGKFFTFALLEPTAM